MIEDTNENYERKGKKRLRKFVIVKDNKTG